MPRTLLTLVLLALLCMSAQAKPSKILMVVTSHSQLGDTGRTTGFYLSEVTHPYKVFRQAGYLVDFVSPQGGKAPIDGLKKADQPSLVLLKSPDFKRAISNTKRPDQVRVGDYDAVFFAGGHGTMWDFPNNQKLQRLTAELYERGGTVGAVCHGPASLVNVKLSSGKYLVDGQPLAAFTNEEEEASGLTKVMPFLLETKLRSRGAYFLESPNFQKRVAIGDRLITGQNPASATGVAEAMLNSLKSSAPVWFSLD